MKKNHEKKKSMHLIKENYCIINTWYLYHLWRVTLNNNKNNDDNGIYFNGLKFNTTKLKSDITTTGQETDNKNKNKP